jgi:hypothetical protein
MRLESQVGRVTRPSKSMADTTGLALGFLATVARFSRAFHTMGIAVDDLEVR